MSAFELTYGSYGQDVMPRRREFVPQVNGHKIPVLNICGMDISCIFRIDWLWEKKYPVGVAGCTSLCRRLLKRQTYETPNINYPMRHTWLKIAIVQNAPPSPPLLHRFALWHCGEQSGWQNVWGRDKLLVNWKVFSNVFQLLSLKLKKLRLMIKVEH